jgi:hypothetical protein
MKPLLLSLIVLATPFFYAHADCSIEQAKAAAADAIQEEFGGDPISQIQMPSTLAYNKDGMIKVVLASNVQMKSGVKRLMLSAADISPSDCSVKIEATGLTEKKTF